MKQEVVILGGQTIDQKFRVWQVGAQASKFGFYKLIVCIIKKNVMVWNRIAKIYAIGETECEVFILGEQRIDQKRNKGWWRGSRERIEMEAQKVTELTIEERIRNIYTCLCLFPQGEFLLSSRLDSAVKRCSSEVLKLSFQRGCSVKG